MGKPVFPEIAGIIWIIPTNVECGHVMALCQNKGAGKNKNNK
jgi:hypothetical protein